MSVKLRNLPVLISDDNAHQRRLASDVLRGAGIDNLHFAKDGDELLAATLEFHPRIVITASRLPKLSGLEYTRKIRAGFSNVPRTTSVIVMTTTPTKVFLDAARSSGADEMLACPFTAASLLARVDAVLVRPRRFIDSTSYVGPCRRRRMLDDYNGPLRRFSDPLDETPTALWEADSNRELVRICINKISELTVGLTPGDRRKLREIYAAVRETEQFADDVRDEAMGESARSLSRYITGVGATPDLDSEVITTHVDAMHKLALLGANAEVERGMLVEGLVAVVDKRLGRKTAAA